MIGPVVIFPLLEAEASKWILHSLKKEDMEAEIEVEYGVMEWAG